MKKQEYSTLNDGCEGDSGGLAAALGADFEVLYENYDAGSWGHHSGNATFRATDGRFIHADCGGCSCGGSGNWDYCDSEADAMLYVPEQERV